MIKHVGLIAVEDTVAIVIPQDVAERLRLRPGGAVAFDDESNTIELKHAESEFDRQMAIARKVMQRNWNVLRALAK